MADFRIRRGYNIRITGAPEGVIENAPAPERVALKPSEFRGIRPRLAVEVGSRVAVGSPLFHDKSSPDIVFTAPAGGRVSEIRRGERRIIEAVIIDTDGKKTKAPGLPGRKELGSLRRGDILAVLLKTGLFPCLRQRPFQKIPDPAVTPRDIFVSALNTAPLAADPVLIARENEDFLRRGLDVLARLTDGKVHLAVEKGRGGLPPVFTKAHGVEIHRFNPLHPAGNPGVQIHHIAPVRHGSDIVWQADLQGVIRIGRLYATGALSFDMIAAVSGEGAPSRKHFRSVTGASIRSLAGHVENPGDFRFISGDVLSGTDSGYHGFLGFYDSCITVIPEARDYEFLGWLSPGLRRESVSNTFLSRLTPGKKFPFTTNRNGSVRAFVATGIYERVLPMDIYPMHLLKSILAEDIEEMEKLGIYEVAEEDFALCEFVCPSKINIQGIIRRGIELMEKEA